MSEPENLIGVHALHSRLGRPNLRIVDCRFSLLDTQKGRSDYASGHIPGAVYADLDRDLAAIPDASSGRHPLPEPAKFIETLRLWGIDNDSDVVAYDDASGGVAARLWWMLRWLGHRKAAVLDGGFAAWVAAGYPQQTETPRPPSGDFSGQPDDGLTIGTKEVQASLVSREGFVLVDARDNKRFRGEVEPIDPVAGHVPGALNLPFTSSLAENGLWRSPDELARLWSNAVPQEPERAWGVMCGSGVTACHLALSAVVAGLPEPRLYVGSWSEWVRDPDRPVAGQNA